MKFVLTAVPLRLIFDMLAFINPCLASACFGIDWPAAQRSTAWREASHHWLRCRWRQLQASSGFGTSAGHAARAGELSKTRVVLRL